MGSLRTTIGNRLPPGWANRARGVVRGLDRLIGLPLSPLRPGAVSLFHIGRCGSSVLGNLLDQHPAIRWDREIYFHWWTRSDKRFQRWDSETFLRRNMWAAGRRWYGFEMKFLAAQHLAIVGLPLAEYVAEIERAGVTRHVVLERRNALRRMISQKKGRSSKQRHARVGEERESIPAVTLDVESTRIWKGGPAQPLLACIDEITETYAELLRLLGGREVLQLTFEEDIAAEGPHRAYERMCAFLGLEPVSTVVHTQRLHAQPVRELVENFDQVAAALRGTPHEWMLDD
jgi:hypothetical protein